MNEVSLPSRHRIRNWALLVYGRAHSVTEAAHNIQYLRLSREETFCFFETWMPEQETNPRTLTFLAGTRTPPPALRYCYYTGNYTGYNTGNTNTLPVDLTSWVPGLLCSPVPRHIGQTQGVLGQQSSCEFSSPTGDGPTPDLGWG